MVDHPRASALDDAGCKTPERVAPSAEDVRVDNRNFPARFAEAG